MSSYHGIKPPTKEDAQMANSHLDRTFALNASKIAEHQAAKRRAIKMGNQKSVAYNDSHLTKHQDDNKQVMKSKKTLQGLRSALKPIAKQVT